MLGTHNVDDKIDNLEMRQLLAAAANEFISNNMENCIHIWKDNSNHTSVLTVSIAEDLLLQNGLMINAGFNTMFQISVNGAGVSAADQTTGTVRAGTFAQKLINDAIRNAKLNNKNYAVAKMNLEEFDKEYPWLTGKKKVLNIEIQFMHTETVQFG